MSTFCPSQDDENQKQKTQKCPHFKKKNFFCNLVDIFISSGLISGLVLSLWIVSHKATSKEEWFPVTTGLTL